MPSTTNSSRCTTTFFNLRSSGSSEHHRAQRSQPGPGQPGCGRIDRVVQWVGNGVATAFFASLERCSCINISTDEDLDEARDLPLIHDDGNARGGGFGGGEGLRRRVRGKGKKSGSRFYEDFYG